VQKIAEEAASQTAADAPVEEEVVVVVEELPPGESGRAQRGRSTATTQEAETATLGMLAQPQKFFAEAISRWTELTTPFAAGAGAPELGGFFDPRRMTQEGFRFAEELLASQKNFALKVVETMSPRRAA
jgi:hypothetical protein